MDLTGTTFRACLFDVDRTLTTSTRAVTVATKEALKQLVAAGFTCGFCTGKPFTKLVVDQLNTLLPARSLHVLSGGSQLVTGTGEVVWEEVIPEATIKRLYQFAEEHHAGLVIKRSHDLLANETAFAITAKTTNTLISVLKPLKEFDLGPAPAATIINPTPELLTLLQQETDLTVKPVNLYGNTVADISRHGVTKATGVHEWSKRQHIKPEEIIGFGDGENDVEFLKSVGYVVAPQNAVPEVQALADVIVPTSDQNGVAQFITKFLETKKK